jgi:electron transfer flavoprotein alpha subunit
MDKLNYKDMWVHVEQENGKIHPVSLELCCEIRKLCDKSGDALVAVAAGSMEENELNKLKNCGVDRIILVSGSGYEHYNTEAFSNLYMQLCNKYRPSAVFVGATVNGRDFAPHFAAELETGCTSDATELIFNTDSRDIEFVEPAAGGKIMAVITIPEKRPQVGTIRPGIFKYAPAGIQNVIEIINETVDFDVSKIRTKLLSYTPDEFDPELDITNCDIIICVGSALKDESLPKYKELAKLLGGKLACTRPVVDRELLPYKLQVGQSGVMIKPRLYIGFGISGAVNHVTGVDAATMVAVNTDSSAPIFNYCDYGIVADMDEVCQAMIDALKGRQ